MYVFFVCLFCVFQCSILFFCRSRTLFRLYCCAFVYLPSFVLFRVCDFEWMHFSLLRLLCFFLFFIIIISLALLPSAFFVDRFCRYLCDSSGLFNFHVGFLHTYDIISMKIRTNVIKWMHNETKRKNKIPTKTDCYNNKERNERIKMRRKKTTKNENQRNA